MRTAPVPHPRPSWMLEVVDVQPAIDWPMIGLLIAAAVIVVAILFYLRNRMSKLDDLAASVAALETSVSAAGENIALAAKLFEDNAEAAVLNEENDKTIAELTARVDAAAAALNKADDEIKSLVLGDAPDTA